MFEIPGSGINAVHVTEEYVKGESGPIYMRSGATVENTADDEEVKSSLRI